MSSRGLLGAFILAAAFAVLALLAASAATATTVDSDIGSDTTWNIGGSPYTITQSVYVQDGATLTIEPGVEVVFAGRYFLDCTGTGRILARGTATDPITVTSGKTSPQIGDWNYVSTGAGGEFRNVTIEYGSVNLYVEQDAEVTDCSVRIGTTGVYVRGDSALVHRTSIWGMTVALAAADVSGVQVSQCDADNCQQGFNMLGSTQGTVFEGCSNNNSNNHGFGYQATGVGNVIRDSWVTLSQYGVRIQPLAAPAAEGGLLVYNCTLDACSEVGIEFDTVNTVQTIKVQRCKIWNGNVGILATSSGNFEVTETTLRENNRGSKVEDCLGYTAYFHKNNYIKNVIAEAESVNSQLNYDKDGFGNFWWRGIHQYGFKDNDGDGIADRSWVITGTQEDHYPLMKPVDYEAPVANAGPDLKKRQHRKFDLDGQRSTDNTWIANYTWTVDLPLPHEDLVFYGVEAEASVHVAGVFPIVLTVTDPVGHTDSDTLTINVTDGDPPVLTEITTPSNVSAGGVLNFSAVIDDNVGVSVAWVVYKMGLAGTNKRLDLVHQEGTVWATDIDVPLDLDQKIYYTLSAKDFENNIVRSLQMEVAVLDSTAPTVELAMAANVTTGDPAWLNATITDNRQVGQATVEYWFGEGPHETANLSMVGLLWVTEIEVPWDAPTPLHLVFVAVDVKGNTAQLDAEVEVVDNDPPVLNMDRTDPKFHKGETATFRAVISDNIAIAHAFVEVRYPPVQDYTATPLSLEGDEWVGETAVARTGVWIYYHFRAEDSSGNVMVTPDKEEMLLSQRPHVVAVPDGEAWEGKLFYQDFEAVDPDNEAYELAWDMDTNATWLEVDRVEGNISGTPLDAHVGWYWVNMTVTDPDGVSDWFLYNVTVHDVNAPPAVTINFPEDGQRVGSVLRVTGRASDDLGEIEWVRIRIDDGEWENVTGKDVWEFETRIKGLKPGTHFVEVVAYDGVSESQVAELTFVVPKSDKDKDDGPGFGAALAALAMATALGAAFRLGRRSR